MKLLAVWLLSWALASAQDKPADAAPKPGSIAGTVTAGAGGLPMKDVEIYVRRNTPQESMVLTDSQGRYVVRDVAPGQLRISANAPDSSGRAGFGPNASRQIVLAPGQELTGVDFPMVIQGRISGKVVDQNNEPVVGISVFLVAREYSYGALRAVFAGAGSTDDQGEYRLERVHPGRAYRCWPAGGGARFRRFRTRRWSGRCACPRWCPRTFPTRDRLTERSRWCCARANCVKA
jgi:hypothetical protein